MLRVVATIMNSPYAEEYSAQTANLTSWVVEIVEAAFELQRVRFFLLALLEIFDFEQALICWAQRSLARSLSCTSLTSLLHLTTTERRPLLQLPQRDLLLWRRRFRCPPLLRLLPPGPARPLHLDPLRRRIDSSIPLPPHLLDYGHSLPSRRPPFLRLGAQLKQHES